MRGFARSARMIAVAAVLALAVLIGRGLWANGVFSTVKAGFYGTCKALPGIPGVEDIEIAGGMAFVSVASARGPDAADGIYAMPLAGDAKLTRLSGTPKDFHPRGIGLLRSPDGTGLFLMAVNRRSTGRFSIDSFEVTNPASAPTLVAQGTVEGGLLNDPQDVAPTGPDNFYVSNTSAREPLVRWLAGYGVMPGSDILYFNGMSFRPVAQDLYGARGLVLTPGGDHLLVASLTRRALRAFSRESFTGNLTQDGSLTLPTAPEKITLDANGAVWAAGHANLLRWRDYAADPNRRAPSQVFRISLAGGVPQAAEQVYGDDGTQIAGASAAAAAGQRLLIGSSLDGKLLDCVGK